MIRHKIDTCSDDLDLLAETLDRITSHGGEIISVMWQAKSAANVDQAEALSGSGSFVIVSQMEQAIVTELRAQSGEEIAV